MIPRHVLTNSASVRAAPCVSFGHGNVERTYCTAHWWMQLCARNWKEVVCYHMWNSLKRCSRQKRRLGRSGLWIYPIQHFFIPLCSASHNSRLVWLKCRWNEGAQVITASMNYNSHSGRRIKVIYNSVKVELVVWQKVLKLPEFTKGFIRLLEDTCWIFFWCCIVHERIFLFIMEKRTPCRERRGLISSRQLLLILPPGLTAKLLSSI